MSWRVINQILGLASVDQDFCRALLDNPLKASAEKGFELTPEERNVLANIQAQDIYEFSQAVVNKLGQSR